MAGEDQAQIEQAFQLCKLQASVDGAFPDELLQFWFQAAWDLCVSMVGWTPVQEIEESICVDDCGNFSLSQRPTSPVQIFDGYRLVATLPPSLKRDRCTPALCCLCAPKARYTVGYDSPCGISPRFLQAVARVFTYMVENRGDSEMDEAVLGKSGAKVFLGPDLAYVA